MKRDRIENPRFVQANTFWCCRIPRLSPLRCIQNCYPPQTVIVVIQDDAILVHFTVVGSSQPLKMKIGYINLFIIGLHVRSITHNVLPSCASKTNWYTIDRMCNLHFLFFSQKRCSIENAYTDLPVSMRICSPSFSVGRICGV